MQHPSFLEAITLQQFLLFIELSIQLRPLLELTTSSTLPPLELAPNILQFFSDSLSSLEATVDTKVIEGAWDILADFIWDLPDRKPSPSLLQIFLKYGTPLGIG
jgi:hypothetical protein